MNHARRGASWLGAAGSEHNCRKAGDRHCFLRREASQGEILGGDSHRLENSAASEPPSFLPKDGPDLDQVAYLHRAIPNRTNEVTGFGKGRFDLIDCDHVSASKEVRWELAHREGVRADGIHVNTVAQITGGEERLPGVSRSTDHVRLRHSLNDGFTGNDLGGNFRLQLVSQTFGAAVGTSRHAHLRDWAHCAHRTDLIGGLAAGADDGEDGRISGSQELGGDAGRGAPVRIAVSEVPSSKASGVPVKPSNQITSAWMVGSPRPGLSGRIVIAFNTAPPPSSWRAIIARAAPLPTEARVG